MRCLSFMDNGVKHMYKPLDKLQRLFLDFNQPMGLKMNPDNRWVKMADRIPWDKFETMVGREWFRIMGRTNSHSQEKEKYLTDIVECFSFYIECNM